MLTVKITCNREQLLAAFGVASMAVDLRCSKSVLQNVKLVAADGRVVLMGTDLSFGVRVDLQGVDVAKPGAVVIPPRRFESIVKEMTDDEIQIECVDSTLKVRSTRSIASLPTLDPGDFPSVSAATGSKANCEIPSATLCELIRRTEIAADVEDGSRYALNSLLLEIEGSKINAVATDGHCMAVSNAGLVAEGDIAAKSALIPLRSVRLIRRILSGCQDGIAELWFGANELTIRVAGAMIVARQSEGRFPQWQNVVPRFRSPVSLNLDAAQFGSAVRQLTAVSNPDLPGVVFNVRGGELHLKSHSANFGEVNVDIPVSHDGREVETRLNEKYLKGFLATLRPGDSFTAEIDDCDSAALFRSSENSLFVIMPLSRR